LADAGVINLRVWLEALGCAVGAPRNNQDAASGV
jgi:hypothetical protein